MWPPKQKQTAAAAKTAQLNLKCGGKPQMRQKSQNRQLCPNYGNNLWIIVPHSISDCHIKHFQLKKGMLIKQNVSKHE